MGITMDKADGWDALGESKPLITDASLIDLTSAFHASAPEGYKCADCTLALLDDKLPCPQCYTAWWKKLHPDVVFV